MPSFAMKTLFFNGNDFDSPDDPPADCVSMLHREQLLTSKPGWRGASGRYQIPLSTHFTSRNPSQA